MTFSGSYYQIILTFSKFILNYTDIFKKFLTNNTTEFLQSLYQANTDTF